MVNVNTDASVIAHQAGTVDLSQAAAGAGRLPTFVIIGAARSGTTSMHYVLGQHPEIYMSPNKETNFFSYLCSAGESLRCTRVEDVRSVDGRSVKTLDDYRSLFRAVGRQTAIGEASPSYLLLPEVPAKIREMLPTTKIIAVLRQPIVKAYSHFLRKCQTEIYPHGADFAVAVEQDEERIKREGRGTSFLQHARYVAYLKRYYDIFPREQIKICLFEDMEQQPAVFYRELFEFLGVDPNFKADFSTKFNQSGGQKSNLLTRLTPKGDALKSYLRRTLPPAVVTRLSRWHHKMRSANIERPPALSDEMRRQLTKRYFSEEIPQLETLTGLDLSRWWE